MTLPQAGLTPGTEVSRFRVEELLGRGGMGNVYRARDLRLDRPVALKVLSPELSDDEGFRQRFARECRLAAALDHPHVVPVYEADDWHGLLYIVMRLVDGADLHRVLTGGPLETPTALSLLDQAAAALDAAHAAGLVHRDVKPGNLLVTGARAGHVPVGGHLYLTDFGLTKRTSSMSGLTSSGQFLGSLHYVAPEQIRGEAVDGRADLYALACVAFELLTGTPPFRRDQEAALLWAHMSVQPPALTDVRPDLPVPMSTVLARGMAKDRADRPATCAEFTAGLRAAAGAPLAVAAQTGSATGPVPASAPTVIRRVVTPIAGRADTTLAPAGPVGVPPGSRRRGSGLRGSGWRLPVAAFAALAAAVAGLLVWSPWGGETTGADVVLDARPLDVVAYTASIPDDWTAFPSDDGAVTFGPEDLTDITLADEASVAEAAAIASDEPGRLVAVYVAPAAGLENEAAADVPGQVAAGLPAGTELRGGAMTAVGGQEAQRLSGEVPLDDDTSLQVTGIAVGGDVLLLCVAPQEVFDDWAEVFDDVVGSLAPA